MASLGEGRQLRLLATLDVVASGNDVEPRENRLGHSL
jgi:hypothetical protein